MSEKLEALWIVTRAARSWIFRTRGLARAFRKKKRDPKAYALSRGTWGPGS